MTFDAWLTLAVVAVTIAMLASERISPPFAMLGAVTTLLVTGVIDGPQAFAGFSNPAPITVAALYVLARACEVTGALEPLTGAAFRPGRTISERRMLIRVLPPVALSSAFLNNTPIVAMVAPRMAAWARQTGASPSRFLMPVSFAAIIGGLLTMIGTSTNIVVSGLMQQAGMGPMRMFEISRVGGPVAVIGLVVMVAIGPKLLPRRLGSLEDVAADPREFTIEMQVTDGPLAAKSVAEAGLRNLQGVFLVEIERDGHRIAPVGPQERLAVEDRLIFAGNVDRILDLQRLQGLTPASERHFHVTGETSGRRFYEVVVAPGSGLVGATLKQAGFRNRFGAAVVAIHRAGERVPAKLGEVHLRAGDVLLVLADAGFRGRWRDHGEFLVVSPLNGTVPVRKERSRVVLAVLAALLVLVGSGLIDMLQGALLAAGALVMTRSLSASEARDAIDLNIIVLIAASFGLGVAMAQSGLADILAGLVVAGFAPLGGVGILLGVLLATALLTELVTNNAAAVLMFPIAIATASQAGAEPRGFAIAVALGASASFLSPIGYQTNTMVYGMGGYRFTDFARVGFPLTIVMVLVGVLVIPLAWPL